MKYKLIIFKFTGYIFIVSALCFAFQRGKKQGELSCIDFNILPIIADTITVILCFILIGIGIILLKLKN